MLKHACQMHVHVCIHAVEYMLCVLFCASRIYLASAKLYIMCAEIERCVDVFHAQNVYALTQIMDKSAQCIHTVHWGGSYSYQPCFDNTKLTPLPFPSLLPPPFPSHALSPLLPDSPSPVPPQPLSPLPPPSFLSLSIPHSITMVYIFVELDSFLLSLQNMEANWKNGRQSLTRIECHSENSKGVYCLQYDDKKIVSGLRDNTIKVSLSQGISIVSSC